MVGGFHCKHLVPNKYLSEQSSQMRRMTHFDSSCLGGGSSTENSRRELAETKLTQVSVEMGGKKQ